MPARKAVLVRITGHVQGVWFRAWTQERAERLGVAGWVRNAPDGSVSAHLEGPAEAVEAMIAACRSGPPAARVEAVDVTDTAPAGHGGFVIRR